MEKFVFDLDGYAKQAITTRIYAQEVAEPYVLLGLVGEFGEVVEKILDTPPTEQATALLALRKEFGDVLWYLAAIYVDFKLPIVIVGVENEEAYMGEEAFRIMVEIGKIAEVYKKYLRDEWKPELGIENKLSSVRIDKITDSWLKIFQYLCTMVNYFYDDLDEVNRIAQENIEKLAKRKEENKIQGDGDDR